MRQTRPSVTAPSEVSPPENKCTFSQFVALYLPWLLPRAKSPHKYSFPHTSTALENGEPASENVFYLAYGSNLCAATFIGRRQIRPISATNVVVPSLALTFDLPGIAYLEPRFANVRYVTNAPETENTRLLEKDSGWQGGLIGVVYEITPEDYAKILATEGGGAAYQDVIVETFPIPANSADAEPILAHTLLAPVLHVRGEAQPSKRYLDLIRMGADEHRLPQEYRTWLAGLQEYRRTSWRQSVGAVVWAALWLPLTLTLIVLTKVLAGGDGRAPHWILVLQRGLMTLMWASYDGGFKKMFGDGERTEI